VRNAVHVFRMVPQSGKLEAVLAATLLAPLLMLLLFASAWDQLGGLARMPGFWLIMIALASAWPLWRWLQSRLARTAALTLDEVGMTMRSGLPALWRACLRADWNVTWAQIRSVVVIEQLGMVRITPSAGGLPIVLRVSDWLRKDSAGSERASSMRSSPLWQALDGAGLFRNTTPPQDQALTFDLWQHPATRAALLLTACLAAYGAGDGLVQREAWAGYDWRYYLPHLVLGALAFAAAYWLLRRSPTRLPLSIVVFLPALLALAAVMASYSGLIRLNQVAGGPLQVKAYQRNAACDALLPLEKGLPKIEYSALARDYWCAHPAHALHQVPVREGFLGLYQVDLTEHTKAIRRFRGNTR
jgi:hypothetical protein